MLHGLFVLRMSPGTAHDEGALFDTDEVPTDAAENPRRYHGINTVVPIGSYHRRGAPAGPVWLRARGLLTCRYPRLDLDAWRTATPGSPEQITSLPVQLAVPAARAFCAAHSGTDIRATVRGYYVAQTGVYVTGRLLPRKAGSTGHRLSGLRVVASVTYRSATVIPSAAPHAARAARLFAPPLGVRSVLLATIVSPIDDRLPQQRLDVRH